jgi:hypothetical protein
MRLSLYESMDSVKRLYQERHGGQLSSGKATEIVSTFAQGREYFSAAVESGELVRPLLQYYGVLALSRGVILFLKRDCRECTLAPAHGLSCVDWGQILSKGIENTDSLLLRIGGGTFSELLEATQNEERVVIHINHHISRRVIRRPGPSQITSGSVCIRLRELLWSLPDLFNLCVATFGSPAHCYRACVTSHGVGPVAGIIVSLGPFPTMTDKELRGILSLSVEPEHREDRGRHHALGEYAHYLYHFPITQDEDIGAKLPQLKRDGKGATYLVAPFQDGLVLSSLASAFVVSYALGMLVRYHPRYWLALLSHQKGDVIFPLLRAAAAFTQESFPVLILEELEGQFRDWETGRVFAELPGQNLL